MTDANIRRVTVANVTKPFPDAVISVAWGVDSYQDLDCTGWFYEPTVGDALWVDMNSVPGFPHIRKVVTAQRTPDLTTLLLTIQTTPPSGMQSVDTTWVSPGRITAVVAAAPPSTAGSATYQPVDSHTWDPTNNWGLGDSKCRQGAFPGVGPSKGLWFYGAGAFANLAGKTLTSISVTIQRDDRTGSPYAPKSIFVVGHGYAAQPSGEPVVVGSYNVGKLGTTDKLTFPLPLSVATGLQSGALAGVGVASAAQADYLAVLGAGTGSGVLTIGWSS